MFEVIYGIFTKAQFVYDVRKSSDGKLTPNQIALNYLIQFIDRICSFDEMMSSKHGLTTDHLLPFL